MAEVGKTVKRTYSHEVNDEELRSLMNEKLYKPVYEAVKTHRANMNATIKSMP